MAQNGTGANGNSIRGIRARYWHITINNYTETDLAQLAQLLLIADKYVWQEERGENGTPHIQGHICFKNPRDFKKIQKALPRAHIEKVRNIEASKKYCQKLETRNGELHIKGFKKTISKKQMVLDIEYKDVVWKDWQQQIIDILNGPVDKRKIYWFWEETGDVGKSFLAKYLVCKYNCIIATGKTNDIFNQVKEWDEKNSEEIQIPPIIIDNPKSEFGHINYSALEQLKNGFMYSGKYEGGQVVGLSPHCIVFGNSTPDMDQMSRDRWVVHHIE